MLCCDYLESVDTANKWKENRPRRLMPAEQTDLSFSPFADERNLLISRIPPHLTFTSGGVFSEEGAPQFLRGISFHEKRDGASEREGERRDRDLKLDL